MKKYLLMTTCLLAGLYALPAHAVPATPNVWEFYGVDVDGNPNPNNPIAAMDGDTNIPDTTADTNLATKTYLDQPGGYGVTVTAWYKPILSFTRDFNSDKTVSAGAGNYTLNPTYVQSPINESILEHNRGLDPSPQGDGVGLGVQTVIPNTGAYIAFRDTVTYVQTPTDQQEYFDEINFNELIQIDLGVDYAKYKDWYIQLSSMNDSSSDLCNSFFCYQPYNSAEIYTSSSADPNSGLGTLLTTITTDFETSLGSNLQRYLYVSPKALPHTDCFKYYTDDELVNASQCTWDTAFLVRSLSATPIPTETPEPGILGILGFALAGLGYAKSRKQG